MPMPRAELVSLGGSGSAGGAGGGVSVALTSGSDITTYGDGADGAFAQSVGGGGGTGATSGGLRPSAAKAGPAALAAMSR